MQKGRVAAQGPTDEALASGAVGDAFQMDICPHDRICPCLAKVSERFRIRRAMRALKLSAKPSAAYVLYPRSR